MNRLAAAIACDVRLQFRNGFYYAAAFVAVCWIIALYRLPADRLTIFMPVFVLSNLLINTFYFIAGLVFLEKGEGSLMASTVTPLRSWEYLVAKIITLTAMSIAENLAIVALGYKAGFAWPAFLLGVTASAALFALAGFAVAIRYDSINEFLFPSFFITLVFVPPFLQYFGILDTALMYLHPSQAALMLTQAAFFPIETWQWMYAIPASIFWIALGLLYCRGAFARFVTTVEGVA
jgi:fluoroquinolone transport system permease protein